MMRRTRATSSSCTGAVVTSRDTAEQVWPACWIAAAGAHLQRIVPWNHLCRDAERLTYRVVEKLVAERDRRTEQLVGGPRVVLEVARRHDDVALRDAQRLARVDDFDPRELVLLLQQARRDGQHRAAAIGGLGRAPDRQGGARGADRLVDVAGVTAREARDDLSGRW